MVQVIMVQVIMAASSQAPGGSHLVASFHLMVAAICGESVWPSSKAFGTGIAQWLERRTRD